MAKAINGRVGVGLWVALTAMVGCAPVPGGGSDGGGGGGIPFFPSPTPSPSPLVTIDFERFSTGTLPDSFVNVRDEVDPAPFWLERGIWRIEDVDTPQLKSRVLRQSKLQDDPNQTWLSYLRFQAPLFGKPNGQLPPRYRMEVTQQPIASPYNLPPTGDQAIQPYFLDYNHYFEVVTTPNEIQAWVSDGGVPGSGQGWIRLWSRRMSTDAGDTRRIGAIVDVQSKKVTVLYNGHPETTLTVDLIDPSRPHYVALRSIGNEVNFDDLEIERLD